jgi:Arm DNA-binding domain
VFEYRGNRRIRRRMTIARLGELTVEQARKKAAELKVSVRSGADPIEEIRAKRKTADRGIKLATVAEQWMAASRPGWSGDTARVYASTLKKRRSPAGAAFPLIRFAAP